MLFYVSIYAYTTYARILSRSLIFFIVTPLKINLPWCNIACSFPQWTDNPIQKILFYLNQYLSSAVITIKYFFFCYLYWYKAPPRSFKLSYLLKFSWAVGALTKNILQIWDVRSDVLLEFHVRCLDIWNKLLYHTKLWSL